MDAKDISGRVDNAARLGNLIKCQSSGNVTEVYLGTNFVLLGYEGCENFPALAAVNGAVGPCCKPCI